MTNEEKNRELEKIRAKRRLGLKLTSKERYMLLMFGTDDEVKEMKTEAATVKPPIGIVPRNIRDANRLREIGDAIQAHIQYSMEVRPIPINPEWVHEYNELVERMISEKEELAAKLGLMIVLNELRGNDE